MFYEELSEKEKRLINNNIKKIKNILKKKENQRLIDGLFFPDEAINIIAISNKGYFLNSYYNLTTCDILNYIDDFKTLFEIKKDIYKDYKKDYARAILSNFIDVMLKLEFIK